MPDEVLTPDGLEHDSRPVAGLFGKLPATGDFVWRGLPDSFRKHWDFWLSRHIAPLSRTGLALPPEGLRFRLPSGGRLAAGLILPSQDKAGRHFPLSLLMIADADLTPQQIDLWCDAALALSPETLGADPLWLALDALAAPNPEGDAEGPMQIWISGVAPLDADASAPDAALREVLGAGLPPPPSSGGSSTPSS
ncbi:MAG: type VI secretion system-associated protein TagF [Acetobacteraceae bacterium]|nr:MAG: type VI secretion system-associated protein TagF [Acetobacteraceae bacterium]